MAERPILFSGPMIRALLNDSKTQTRRVVKPQPGAMPEGYLPRLYWPARDTHMTHDGTGRAFFQFERRGDYDGQHAASGAFYCPYGQPGDRLRVKEAAWMWCERRPNGKTKTGRDKWLYVPMREAPIHYAADNPKKPAIDVVSPNTGNTWGWRLKIGRFLPRWASRITLEITEVRVERLQDISEADAIAEGCSKNHNGYFLGGPHAVSGRKQMATAQQAYRDLWESINSPGSWEANPWVWVVSFRRVET